MSDRIHLAVQLDMLKELIRLLAEKYSKKFLRDIKSANDGIELAKNAKEMLGI